MTDEKPNGSTDLLVQAIRRVHREQVEGVEKDTEDETAAIRKEIERQTESR